MSDLMREFLHVAIDVTKPYSDPRYLGSEETKEAAINIATTAAWLNELSIPTCWVMSNPDKDAVPNERNLYLARPEKNDYLVSRSGDSVLSSKGFIDILSKNPYKNIIVSGFNSSACVLESVLDFSYFERFNITVLSDCTANGGRASHLLEKEGISEDYPFELMRGSGAKISTSERFLCNLI